MEPLQDSTPGEPIAPVDHAWLRMDEPANLMIINGVLVLREPLSVESLRDILTRRLLPIPRFRQKVVLRDGAPFWEDDPAFRLDDHVVAKPLAPPGDQAALREEISRLMAEPLSRERPLWVFYLFRGFEGDGCVVMARLHHSIGDGMALLLVLLSLTDVTRGPELGPEVPVDDLGNPFTDLFHRPPVGVEAAKQLARRIMPDCMRLMEQTAAAFETMTGFVAGLVSTGAFSRLVFRPPDPKTRFRGPLGIPKRVAWSDAIALDEVREIGKALGGTINDVLLSAMSGGMRRYLDRHGEAWPWLNFRAAMPVNLRSLDRLSEMGNRFGLIFLSLPVGIADAVERLRELSHRASALKRSAEPLVVYGILRLLGVVPLAIQRMVVAIFATKATAVMTNVPGPREVLYLAGKQICDIFFWVPQSGHVGLGVSIFSYAGHVRMGVGTDAGLVPDPEVIVEGFHAEMAELRKRAGFATPSGAAA